ncbi:translocation/assembly module TamB domain-containing protein [Paracoccus sp. S1E-3]|uniref:translocation/assembly module TamB domain-containing protein n=1 Tax=Paracoccus sp. S1E-3 TaxID=2756130 RepID=UPI0015EE6CB4|nr:translocation/assembly module TamB domain-containing protein [Paracoccus sp. S1E-3]MBA4491025.1 translocation/assembly module TamB domain-containing protein [Paracoccus sp. S1E-3]
MLQRILLVLALAIMLPLAAPAQEEPKDDASIARMALEAEDDKGFLTRFLQSRLSGAGRKVQIDGFQGALSSRATFARITISDDEGTWLVLQDGAIQWTRSALLRGRVDIGELSAALIEIPRLPKSEEDAATTRAEARSFNLPELPVGINIAKISAPRVVLGSPVIGEEAEIAVTGAMSLEGGEGTADVVVNRTDGKKGDFVFKGSFDNTSRMLDIDLTLDEDPNGIFSRFARIEGRPAVAATVKGSGPLDDFSGEAQIATDGVDRVTGKLVLNGAKGPDGSDGNSFDLQLGGDLSTLLPPENREFFGNSTQIVAKGWRGDGGQLDIESLNLDTDALKIDGRLVTNDQNAPQLVDLQVDFGQQAGADTLPVKIPFVDPPITVLSGELAIGMDTARGPDWTLKGWLSEIDREGTRIARLDLDGQGRMMEAVGGAVQKDSGSFSFDASGIQLVSERLQKVVGDRISGKTSFEYTPGQVFALTGMEISGKDYGLDGALTVDGLTSGIVLSTEQLIARHDDLSNLSELAGRQLSGRAEADLAGYYQVLTGAFDVEGTVTGTDLTVDEPRMDRLLAGESTIDISAGRTEDGTELRELTVNAQRISLSANGNLTGDNVDLTATFNMPTLADLDPAFEGALTAQARLTGAPGARQAALKGRATGLKTGIAALDGAFSGESQLTATVREQEGGSFNLTGLELKNPQLALTGAGSFAGGDVDGRFDLDFSDLGALGQNFGGLLKATAQIQTEGETRSITVTGTGTDLSVGQAQADNALRGETRLTVSAEQKGDLLNITEARAENRQLVATAKGAISPSGTNINAHAEIGTLGALAARWQGALSADAILTQAPGGARNLRVDAVGQNIALGQVNADGALSGQTDITLLAEQTPDGAIEVKSVDIRNPQMTANASGRIKDGAVDGQAAAQVQDLSLLGRGWEGSLDATAKLSTDDAGTRQVEIGGTGQNIRLGQAQADAALTGTTTLDILAEQAKGGAIHIARANVVNDQLNITAEGDIGDTRTDATAKIVVRDLASLGLGLQGALDVDARFADTGDGARRLTVTGEGENLALGQAGLQGANGRSQIDISALERDGTYTIEKADLLSDQNQIRASGVIAPTGTDAKAQLRLGDLADFGLGASGALNADATLTDDGQGGRNFTLTGTATDLALNQAGPDRALKGETRIQAQGSQKDGLITVDEAQIDHPQLTANASGTWGTGQTDLDATLRAGDLAFLGRGFGGALDAQIKVADGTDGRSFDMTGTAQALRVGNAQADAALSGETRLAVQAVQEGGRFTITRMQAENPQVQVDGKGVIGGGQTDFEAQAVSRNLAFLGAGYSGSVQAGVKLRDQGGLTHFDVTGTGTDISAGSAQLNSALRGDTTFVARGTRAGALIRLEEARAQNGQITATAAGTYGAGQTDLRAQLETANLGFVTSNLRGTLTGQAQVVDLPDGQRRITAEGSANGLAIGNSRVDGLLGGQTRFQLAAVQGPQGFRLERLDARNPQVQVLPDGNPAEALNIDARLANLSVLVPGLDGPAQATGTLRQAEGRNDLDIAITAPGGTRAQLSGSLAGEATDLRVSGVSDTAVVNPLLRTRSIEGPASFDLRMQGTPGLEAISGTVNLTDNRLAEPRLGLSVEDLNLIARFDRGVIRLDVDGDVSAGGGLAVNGSVDLRTGSPVLDLTARLNNAVLRDPALYELTAAGTVSITGRATDGPLVSGTVNILEAEFRIPSSGLGGAQAIPPIIHVGDDWKAAATRAKAGLEPYGSAAAQAAGLAGPAATPPANPARFDLTINAPNQIFVRGRGVDAELGGDLRLTGDARTPVPIGHLSLIRGRVDLLGKRFDLVEGLIEMQGSLVPVLRLVAIHTQSDISIRIVIDGDLREPDITFESDPELPEEEVLSYLLFGRGLDQISPLQAAQLANALAVLAGRGGIGIIGNIREATGLDDLDMTINDDGSVAVRAGKYLTRNVYTDVEVDDEGKSRINLNLDVTEAMTVRGSVGSDGDTTLGVAFEKDY